MGVEDLFVVVSVTVSICVRELVGNELAYSSIAQTVSAAESSAGAQSMYFVTPGSFAIEYFDTVINFSRIWKV